MGKRGFALISSVFVASFGLVGSAQAKCADDIVSLRGAFGTAQFTVDVADDNEERAQGLMFVEQMATMEGMFFIYETPRTASFWMRNTLIPLDMVFTDGAGVVQNIHANAVPLDETPIYGGDDIQFVLEINGGLAARLGLAAGDQMQHPAFAEASTSAPVWPCEIN